MWTCLLFRTFKRCNIPMVAMGTVTPKYFHFPIDSNDLVSVLNFVLVFFLAVSSRPGTSYREEKQAYWDFPLLPCTSYWELLYMHGRRRIFTIIKETEEGRRCSFQHFNRDYHALLRYRERCLPIQVPECSWLGFWCASTPFRDSTQEKMKMLECWDCRSRLFNSEKFSEFSFSCSLQERISELSALTWVKPSNSII